MVIMCAFARTACAACVCWVVCAVLCSTCEMRTPSSIMIARGARGEKASNCTSKWMGVQSVKLRVRGVVSSTILNTLCDYHNLGYETRTNTTKYVLWELRQNCACAQSRISNIWVGTARTKTTREVNHCMDKEDACALDALMISHNSHTRFYA